MRIVTKLAGIAVAAICGAALLSSCGGADWEPNPDVEFFRDLGIVSIHPSGATTNAPPAPEGWTRYEAEDFPIHNWDRGNAGLVDGVESHVFYSGGRAAGGLGSPDVNPDDVFPDWSNIGHVRFVVDVPEGGNYAVNIFYNGNDDKQILVKLNGRRQLVRIPNVPGPDYHWNTVFAKRIAIGPFYAGENDLWVSGTIGRVTGDPNEDGWINIDNIDVQDATFAE